MLWVGAWKKGGVGVVGVVVVVGGGGVELFSIYLRAKHQSPPDRTCEDASECVHNGSHGLQGKAAGVFRSNLPFVFVGVGHASDGDDEMLLVVVVVVLGSGGGGVG
jgi:hypothetical protein